MTDLIRRRPLASFFVLAFAGSWVGWSPWWLSKSGVSVLPFTPSVGAIAGINQLGLFAGPFAAAFIVTRAAEGRQGARHLWRRMTVWRVRPVWFLLALVAVPVVTGSWYLFSANGPASDGAIIPGLGSLVIMYPVLVLGGPLQEEPGWRGFALPKLQERLHPLAAALVLGVVHCVWHAPLFVTKEWDTARQDPSQYLAFLVLVVSMSIVMSWLFNGSGGSLLIVILGHNGINWALTGIEPLTGERVANNWPAALGLTVLAIVAVTVTRGQLGFVPKGGRTDELGTDDRCEPGE